MNISIFGLGYVGCVGMGCLAKQGHRIVGVDVSPLKVKLIDSGRATIIEKDIDTLISEGHSKGLISATADYRQAVMDTDISFLCVGTPSGVDGHLNLDYIMQTATQIGEALKDKSGFHIIVIRSTVFPGTNARISAILEEQSGKRRDVDFAVVSNPEFLREGTAVNDYLNPPLTVLGSSCPKAVETMKELYSFTNAPLEVVSIEVAEIIKYVNNSYHALKVTFANEVGDICKQLGVDSHELMRIFCMDTQLNISPYYFKPGFAYGGSCLPKDLKGLQTLAKDLSVTTPVLHSIDKSNDAHIEKACRMIEASGAVKVGILGLSFKAGTDDMRNSPVITIINKLLASGHEVRIFDKNVEESRLLGANKADANKMLPTLSDLLCKEPDTVALWADVLVIANKDELFQQIVADAGKPVIDFVRLKGVESLKDYQGLCW